jgi:CTP-dependent riboflavin kinase
VTVVTLKGRVRKGEGWVKNNWNRMVVAHGDELPEIDGYHPGTLNVQLDELWSPPGHREHHLASHRRGVEQRCLPQTGADFLAAGNYIHPTAVVRSINGISVDGRLYFPGNAQIAGKGEGANIKPTDRIEIISPAHIRSLLGISEDEEVAVEVVIEFEGTTVEGQHLPLGGDEI